VRVIRKLTPAQALGEANRRWNAEQQAALLKAIAPDLARLVAALPCKRRRKR